MIRGATPIHTFKLPFGRESIQKMRITYAQNKSIVLEKNENDVDFGSDNVATLTLSQEDTLQFDDSSSVEIQIQVLTPDNLKLISPIFMVSCGRVLNPEVLS